MSWELLSAFDSPISKNSMMAGSPLNDFAIGAVIYVLLIAVLVVTLLGGAFLILNLGLMSKRGQDRVGGRTPSDVGVLQTTTWPTVKEDIPILPAEEDEENREDRDVA